MSIFYKLPVKEVTKETQNTVSVVFDIPKKSTSLAAFTDSADMASWAGKYFETAVYYGIIVGNGGKLLPKERISIKDALRILRRIKENFSTNYPFNSSHYEPLDSLDVSQVFTKTIGIEYEPRYYKPSATPIKISSITKSKNGNYYILTVNSMIDASKGANDYYWWSTDKGYFRRSSSSQKVCSSYN